MAEEKKAFEIEIRFDQNSQKAEEIQALAQELSQRGHQVTMRRQGAGNFVEEIAKQAKDLRDFAESGYQKLRETLEPVLNTLDKSKAQASEGFDDIGPSANTSAPVNNNQAIVATSPETLDDSAQNKRIVGLITKTSLDRTWQPAMFNSIVIPHAAFRPYLEYIHWNPDRIFEGGYLALSEDKPSLSHEDAMKKFNLTNDNGPIILIMAGGFPVSEMQTLIIQMSLIKTPYQLFFCHGGDGQKAEQLRGFAQRFSVNARMFGRVQALPDYIAMADIAVCDSRDDASIDLIENAGVPAIIVSSGQTPAKANFLIHEHAALLAPQILKLSPVLAPVINDAAQRDNMKKAAAVIAEKASIKLCADAIEAALAKAEDSSAPNQRMAADGDGFETIGQLPTMAQGQDFITPQFQQPQAQQPAQPFEQLNAPAPAQPLAPMLSPVQPSSTPMLMPNLSNMSTKELEAEYTKLIVLQRNIDRTLNEASNEVRMWEERLDLARQNNRQDLISSAITRLETAKQQEMDLLRQKDQIEQQKSIVKRSVRASREQKARSLPTKLNYNYDDDFDISRVTEADLFGPSEEEIALEKEFDALQQQMAMNNLKDKLGRR